MAKKNAGDKPKRGYSWTAIDMYENRCPHAMHLAKDVKPDVGRSNVWRDDGLVGHEIMAAYNQELLRLCVGQDLDVLRQVANQKLHELPEAKLVRHEALREMCETAAIAQGELDYMHVVGIERFFTTKVGRFAFRGKMDLEIEADDTATIRDYKTSNQIMPQREVDDHPQLRIYAWCKLQGSPHIEKVYPELLFMPSGVTMVPESAPWTREDLANVHDDLLAAIENIESDDVYEPQPGDHCGLCEFTHLCPRIREMREANDPRVEDMVITHEDAVRVAGEIGLWERRLKDRKDALKLWSTRNDPVQVDGREFAFRTVTRREFDARAIAVAVKKLERDPFECLRVDAKALDEFTARCGTPEFVQAVKQNTTERAHSQFRARKVKGGDK